MTDRDNSREFILFGFCEMNRNKVGNVLRDRNVYILYFVWIQMNIYHFLIKEIELLP